MSSEKHTTERTTQTRPAQASPAQPAASPASAAVATTGDAWPPPNNLTGRKLAAALPSGLRFSPMGLRDLDDVLHVETALYPFPWTRGNFLDSLYSRYDTWVLRGMRGELVGYFLLMMAVDEAHLLNITVAAPWQGRGMGVALLNKAAELARKKGMRSMLLEVRPSNTRAILVYERYGFERIGLRKNYYPAPDNAREHAIVMRRTL